MTLEIREFATWPSDGSGALCVRKWVPLEDYERVRAKLNFENREPPHCPTCDCNAEPQSEVPK